MASSSGSVPEHYLEEGRAPRTPLASRLVYMKNISNRRRQEWSVTRYGSGLFLAFPVVLRENEQRRASLQARKDMASNFLHRLHQQHKDLGEGDFLSRFMLNRPGTEGGQTQQGFTHTTMKEEDIPDLVASMVSGEWATYAQGNKNLTEERKALIETAITEACMNGSIFHPLAAAPIFQDTLEEPKGDALDSIEDAVERFMRNPDNEEAIKLSMVIDEDDHMVLVPMVPLLCKQTHKLLEEVATALTEVEMEDGKEEKVQGSFRNIFTHLDRMRIDLERLEKLEQGKSVPAPQAEEEEYQDILAWFHALWKHSEKPGTENPFFYKIPGAQTIFQEACAAPWCYENPRANPHDPRDPLRSQSGPQRLSRAGGEPSSSSSFPLVQENLDSEPDKPNALVFLPLSAGQRGGFLKSDFRGRPVR